MNTEIKCNKWCQETNTNKEMTEVLLLPFKQKQKQRGDFLVARMECLES